jgi:hypothetical protein
MIRRAEVLMDPVVMRKPQNYVFPNAKPVSRKGIFNKTGFLLALKICTFADSIHRIQPNSL